MASTDSYKLGCDWAKLSHTYIPVSSLLPWGKPLKLLYGKRPNFIVICSSMPGLFHLASWSPDLHMSCVSHFPLHVMIYQCSWFFIPTHVLVHILAGSFSELEWTMEQWTWMSENPCLTLMNQTAVLFSLLWGTFLLAARVAAPVSLPSHSV